MHAGYSKLKTVSKMLIFDMDNTILEGRFIDTAAMKLGFVDKLAQIRREVHDTEQRTHQIAALLTGVRQEIISEIITDIQVVSDIREVVSSFKGYRLRDRHYQRQLRLRYQIR